MRATETKPRGTPPEKGGESGASVFSERQATTVTLLTQHRYITSSTLQKMHFYLGLSPLSKFNDHLTTLKNGEYINKRIGEVGKKNRVCWHATEKGIDAVCQGNPKLDRGWLHNPTGRIWPYHPLLANRVGLRFCEIALTMGDQCDPYAWEHEIAFKYRKTKRGDEQLLISDMILHYIAVRNGQVTVVPLIIELDRGTQGVSKLAEKVQKYKHLYNTPDAWRERFPGGEFPRLLIITEDDRRGFGGKECAKAIWETHRNTEMPPGFNVGVATKKAFFTPDYEHGALSAIWGKLGSHAAKDRPMTLFSLAPPKRRSIENGGNRTGNRVGNRVGDRTGDRVGNRPGND